MKHLILGMTKFTTVAVLVISLVACGGAEERKAKYLNKSKTYLSEKNYDKAKIEIKNVLQIDPKFAEAYYVMGQIEESKRELGRALGNYKKAIELDPDFTDAKIKLSKIYVIAGTTELVKEASALLADVVKVESDNAEVDLILATIDYKQGKKKQAVSALETVVNKHHDSVEAISLLSTLYLVNKETDKAVALLKKGVADNLENISLRISLARLLASDKNFSEAERYLKQALSIAPQRYDLQVLLSVLYVSSDQKDKAESVLRNAIEQDENDPKRYLLLVEFLSSKVSIKHAEKELEAAIKSKPELYSLKFSQVTFYQKIGKFDEAKSVLKQIINEKSYDIEGVSARIELAKALLKEEDLHGAEKYANEVLKEYPANNDALIITSKLALINLDAASAINGLRTVLKNSPKNAEASLLLAQAHELNNESALAESELKKAIEANPINEKVHLNYARYLGSKGRVDEAVNLVDKALTYFKDSYDLMDLKLKILASQNKESEVLALLTLMEQTNAAKADVNIMKGKYFLSKREMSKAIDEFEKANQKTTDKYQSLKLIVKAYVLNDQTDEAIQRLQKVLDKKPEDAVANLLMGHLYLGQKKITEARVKYLRAIKSAENWFLAYSSLASSYVLENKIDKAFEVYQKAEKKVKNKTPVLMQIAALHERTKDFSAAMKVYKKILVDSPANKLASNNYAALLLDYGEASDASKALELAKGFENISQPALQDTLGWAYAKSGNAKKAVEILKPIVEKAPKIAVFRYHLGYALYEMGDKAAAKSHLQIASSSEQVFPGKLKAKELLKTL